MLAWGSLEFHNNEKMVHKWPCHWPEHLKPSVSNMFSAKGIKELNEIISNRPILRAGGGRAK
jgi:hypothetical protein